jgi:hypothetical protein
MGQSQRAAARSDRVIVDPDLSSQYVTGVPCSFVRCVLLAATTLIAGCPETDENFQLSFKVVQVPSSSAECGPIVDSAINLSGRTYTLRLTFLERPRVKSDGVSKEKEVTPATLRDFTLICQRVILPGEKAELVVPVGDRQAGNPISVMVETFKDGKLIHVGRRDDINLTSDRTSENRTIYLRQTIARNPSSASAGFSCMQKTRGYRAFHSATLLPNGQVLILGGLVAGSDASVIKFDASATAHATGDVEVYDPTKLLFLRPTISGTAPRPRAFHVAQLLPSPARGPYRILLLGGVMPPKPNQPAFRLKSSTTPPFLISPHEKALAAPAAVLTYTPSPMKISYEELPNLQPQMMFPAAALAYPSTALAVAGGAASTTDLNLDITTAPNRGFTGAKTASWFSLSSGAAPAVNTSVPMLNVRVGHTLARLGAGQYIAVGGNMNGVKSDVIEVHTVGGGSNFTQAVVTPKTCATDAECNGFKCDTTKSICPGRVSTVWHTLTPIGSSDQQVLGASPTPPTAALWAGGYTLAEEGVNLRLANSTPQPAALQLIRLGTPLNVDLVAPSASGGFTSVGYHDAVRLYDGSVMLTGGNLPTVLCPQDCGTCPGQCGDGKCYAPETCLSCPKDCDTCPNVCGDGKCISYETCSSCPKDCGGCPNVCGDGKCVYPETCLPTSPFDGSNQLAIYSRKDGARQGLPSLRVSRFGHRSTRLLDNTIMITGGITVVVKGNTPEPQLTTVTERFNPRTGDVTEDYPLNRPKPIDGPTANSGPGTCMLRAEVVEE